VSAATRWITIVVGLLGGNALAVAILIGAAGGDTERRVVPDYYARAADWDATMAEAAASARLGWRGELVAHGRALELMLRGGDGAPIAGAAVVVRGTPRGNADELHELTLREVAPGRYRGVWPVGRGGLHTLTLAAERGGDRWVADRVIELTATGAP
jgi:nitrogen fixation protein FixH